MGVSKTQIVKYIRKGDPGDKGEQGAVLRGPQAWSDCATGYTFQSGAAGEQWQDVVMYNSNYYVCKVSHVKNSGNYPTSTTDVNDGLWQLGDKIDLVATKILLATYALVENLGVTAIDMKDADGNVVFQAKDGNVTCKTGTFENIDISGSFKSSVGGDRVEIVPTGTDRVIFKDDNRIRGLFRFTNDVTGKSLMDMILSCYSNGVTTYSYFGSGRMLLYGPNNDCSAGINLRNGVAEVNLTGLPTSATGLASGRLWRDGTTIKIVP